jgi:hypothetical protein
MRSSRSMDPERFTVRVVTLVDHKGLTERQALAFIGSLPVVSVNKAGKTFIVILQAKKSLGRGFAGWLRG